MKARNLIIGLLAVVLLSLGLAGCSESAAVHTNKCLEGNESDIRAYIYTGDEHVCE